ncbi:hypothetical protein KMZ93_09720 [Bradyrhizobium sediminis]|uniref:Uncharacterized protein n=1 Tax=Bradyrhizobium sediminis TaxID=2840469 RepID=A0A975RZH1_9BRAD|nr:hypothetical protein [Bradyrhizobium sediminis]QWG25126.1 hypothetical protein KMZ93_09720 [Bradyrhizobium sediminis]
MSNSKLKRNALSHGFYSSDVVLPWENQQSFDDLLQALRDEYCPGDVSEEAAVFDLASLHWKKRRFEAGLKQALQKQGDPTVADASSDDWDRVADDARAAAKSQIKAAQVVCDMIFKHMERIIKPDEAKADSEAVEFEKLTTLAKELNLVSKDLVVPTLHAAEKQKLDQIERAYHPDITERELKIRAEIDRSIEKALKRLVLIKEFKKFYLPKAIGPKSVEIEVLPAKPTGGSGKTDPEG